MRMLLHSYLYGVSADSDQISRDIPDIHQFKNPGNAFDGVDKKRLLVKSHFCLSAQHPYATATAGCIYIMRDPRDVLLSNARYFGADSDSDTLRAFATSFIKNLGVARWRQMNMGSWPEHISSWLFSVNKLPLIFIKYSDLRNDTANTLRQVLKFLGEQLDESRIQSAVEHCALDKAREFEMKEKKSGRKSLYIDLPNNELFVGTGKIGQSLEHVGKDIEELYNKNFGSFVRIFGYEAGNISVPPDRTITDAGID